MAALVPVRWARVFALASSAVAAFLLAVPADAKDDPSRRVILHLRDSTLVMGTLLEATGATVTVDPEGDVTVQVVPSSSVAYLVYGATGRSVPFPLDDPSSLAGQMPNLSRAREAPGQEFGLVHLGFAVGAVKASGTEGANFYEGFDSGPGAMVMVRVMLPRPDPRSLRTFAELSYRVCRLGASVAERTQTDPGGDTLRLRFEDMTVHRIALDAGITTPRLGARSFLYASGGFAYLHHSSAVQAQFSPSGGSGTPQSVEVTASGIAARFGAGAVIEPLPRWGIELRGDLDLLLGKPKAIAGYDVGLPSHQGLLAGIAIGIVREL